MGKDRAIINTAVCKPEEVSFGKLIETVWGWSVAEMGWERAPDGGGHHSGGAASQSLEAGRGMESSLT